MMLKFIFSGLFIMSGVMQNRTVHHSFRNPVSSFAELQEFVNNANEDVKTIIPIDSFSMSNTALKDAMRNLNVIGKNIVIKGNKPDTTITSLDQGSIYIIGQSGKTNNITFENITFKQEIDSSKTIMTPNNAVSLSKNSYSTNLTFKHCSFVDFTGVANTGGAIQAAFSNATDCTLNLTIDDCTFKNCYSKLGGGAISCDGNDNVNINIKNSTFEDNSSSKGGAISTSMAKVSISNTLFKNNSSKQGGAISLVNCGSFITGSSFSNNVSEAQDGNSIYVIDSKINTNTFINNSFNNTQNSFKEFYFGTTAGNLTEVKSKLYFNTFVSNQNNEIHYENYEEHVDELANLYISNSYTPDLSKKQTNAYTSNTNIIKTINDRYHLSNNESLLLNKEDYINKLESFYVNVYGDFYIGNNLTNKVNIKYNKENMEFDINDDIELNKTKFGYDLVENKIDNTIFNSKKCLISSNSPIVVTTKYKLNIKGGATFIITPIVVTSIIFISLYFSLIRKKDIKKEEQVIVDSSFNLNEWVDHSVSEDKFKILTNKEKEVLSYILKGTPRKEIAAALFMSESTVKNHVTKIYSKLNVKNRSELLKLLNK